MELKFFWENKKNLRKKSFEKLTVRSGAYENLDNVDFMLFSVTTNLGWNISFQFTLKKVMFTL